MVSHTFEAAAAAADALAADRRSLSAAAAASNTKFASRLRELRRRLPAAACRRRGPPAAAGGGGPPEQICEWGAGAGKPADAGHRHFSHLYPLHPGGAVSPLASPELAAAARRALVERLRHGGGPHRVRSLGGGAVGSAPRRRARACGGAAHDEGVPVARRRRLHPPLASSGVARCPTCVKRRGGAREAVYQLDANAGLTAAIAETLLQSHAVRSRCAVGLSTLPPRWRSGEVAGCARAALSPSILAGRRERLARVRIASIAAADGDFVLAGAPPLDVCCAATVCADNAPTAVAAGAELFPPSVWRWTVTNASPGRRRGLGAAPRYCEAVVRGARRTLARLGYVLAVATSRTRR